MPRVVPSISVIMPVRNAVAYLGWAVESVLAQTWGDLELLAIDDGSSDGSLELLRLMAKADTRMRVLDSPGRGIVDALNHGVRAARADLVARMDADDVCEPGRLETQLERMLSEPDLGVLGTSARTISDAPTPGLDAYHGWVATLTSHDLVVKGCLVESPLVHSSVLARRGLLQRHLYRCEASARLEPFVDRHDSTAWPEDYDLWLRLLRRGVRLANLSDPLVRVRVHPTRTTVTGGFGVKAMARIKMHHLLQTTLAFRPPVVVQGAGHHGKMWLRKLCAAKVPVAALLDVAPGRLGKRIDGVSVRPVHDLPGIERALVIVAVGQKGPNTRRDEVRAQLDPMGLDEGVDYVFVC